MECLECLVSMTVAMVAMTVAPLLWRLHGCYGGCTVAMMVAMTVARLLWWLLWRLHGCYDIIRMECLECQKWRILPKRVSWTLISTTIIPQRIHFVLSNVQNCLLFIWLLFESINMRSSVSLSAGLSPFLLFSCEASMVCFSLEVFLVARGFGRSSWLTVLGRCTEFIIWLVYGTGWAMLVVGGGLFINCTGWLLLNTLGWLLYGWLRGLGVVKDLGELDCSG